MGGMKPKSCVVKFLSHSIVIANASQYPDPTDIGYVTPRGFTLQQIQEVDRFRVGKDHFAGRWLFFASYPPVSRSFLYVFIKIEKYANRWIDQISGGDSKVLDVIRSIYKHFNSVSAWMVARMEGGRTIVQGYPDCAQPRSLNSLNKSYLSLCVEGIDGSGSERSCCDEKHKHIKNYFPPWRFVMAALAGIVGVCWGWWNLRNELRENVGTVAFLGGLILWMYAVGGLLLWGFE